MDWVISMGVHDRYTELHRFSHADLEKRLFPIRPPSSFAHRAGSADNDIFTAVATLNEYGLPDHLNADDVVLDIGAHVGSFAKACRDRGAGLVFCVEPHAETYRLLCENAKAIGGIETVQAAAWRSDRPGGGLRLSFPEGDDGRHTGDGTVLQATGDMVLSVPFDILLDRAARASKNGRVKLLKLDCEGAEWPIIATSRKLGLVDEVVGEFHSAHLLLADPLLFSGLPEFSVEWLKDRLEQSGFSVDLQPTEHGRGLFKAKRERPTDG